MSGIEESGLPPERRISLCRSHPQVDIYGVRLARVPSRLTRPGVLSIDRPLRWPGSAGGRKRNQPRGLPGIGAAPCRQSIYQPGLVGGRARSRTGVRKCIATRIYVCIRFTSGNEGHRSASTTRSTKVPGNPLVLRPRTTMAKKQRQNCPCSWRVGFCS